MLKEKKAHLRERDKFEELILFLEKSNTSREVQDKIDMLKIGIDDLLSRVPNDDHKLFLSEIISREKTQFISNNLILAPVGSGKTTLIESLIESQEGRILMLVSNRFLKESTCPSDSALKKARAKEGKSQMMFTTNNDSVFGDKNYTIHVMTYAEFGSRIQKDNNFIKENKFVQIHCDEVHSLPEYKKINNSEPLIHAIKYLFSKHENQQIFYYTATRENLDSLGAGLPGTFKDVKVYNFLIHPDIKKYMALSEYKINHIEQIRPHLKARLENFDYFGHKGLAFNRTIGGLKVIEKILIEEGYKPLILWSDNNKLYPLSKMQLEAREELIITNKIPAPYNFLVINSSMREGWDLKDPKLKLAIMNTTNSTDKIQALGRIRKDIDVLLYRANETLNGKLEIEISDKFLNGPLTAQMKKALCAEINYVNKTGKVSQWVTIKPMLEKSVYSVEETRSTVDGKRVKVSIITKKI